MQRSMKRRPDELDELVQELNALCRSATLDLVFRVGEFVMERIFGSDEALWHSEGTRHASYRQLAARGDLLLGASALCRAVSIYVLVEREGGRERWQSLAASHFQEVLPLDFDTQRRLLTEADEQGWSVSRLRSEVRSLRPAAGRPAAHHARSLCSLAQRVSTQLRALEGANWDELEAASVSALSDTFESLRRDLDAVQHALAARERRPELPSDIVELVPSNRVGGQRTRRL